MVKPDYGGGHSLLASSADSGAPAAERIPPEGEPSPSTAGGALASEEVRPVSLIPHEARTGRTLEPALIGSVCPEQR